MKTTKPLIITTLVAGSLLAANFTVHAQNATNSPPSQPPAGSPPPGGPPGGLMMARQLNLTDDQKPKFKSIMESRMQKMRDLRQDPNFASMSPQDRMAKIKAIQDETEAQMKALLTPEQFEQWQKMYRMGMRGRRMGPPLAGPNAAGTNAPAPPPANPPQN